MVMRIEVLRPGQKKLVIVAEGVKLSLTDARKLWEAERILNELPTGLRWHTHLEEDGTTQGTRNDG